LGITPRAIVVINPGNPTGNVLRRHDVEDIIKICYENNILIMADEVYQMNIYDPDLPFYSFRKVMAEMGEPYSSSVELISMHSVSKGLMGECGLRGGFFETHNLDEYASEMLYKLKSIELCANSIGQVATHLMVDPPRDGRESDNCVKLYRSQRNAIKDGMADRAAMLTRYF
jgi:aspartate/methionine/tyrosine aminotransferase